MSFTPRWRCNVQYENAELFRSSGQNRQVCGHCCSSEWGGQTWTKHDFECQIDACLHTEMQLSKHTSRFFWAKRTYQVLTPFMASAPWVKMVEFIFWNSFEDLCICRNVLSVFVDLFLWSCFYKYGSGFAFPLYGSSSLHCAFSCFHLQSLFSPLLFTVSDIYKDKICCAISLKAPWDTPHLERCSLKSLLTVLCVFVCVCFFERM